VLVAVWADAVIIGLVANAIEPAFEDATARHYPRVTRTPPR
jgi:hypothetical protein